jgi:hypothetical protein
MNEFEFEFFPPFYEDHWTEDQIFIVECEYEEGDPSVGLAESIGWIVKSNGKDITHEMNEENRAQIEHDIELHFNSMSEDFDSPDEAQEWHDFDPAC